MKIFTDKEKLRKFVFMYPSEIVKGNFLKKNKNHQAWNFSNAREISWVKVRQVK